MKLAIVESPAKCEKIKHFLGSGWNVVATMGHIRALKSHLDAVGLKNNFTPTYEWLAKKSVKGVRDAACHIPKTNIYLASDDDREGEAISYSVCVLLGLDPETTHRAVFHEITEHAVRHAVENPRRINMNIVNAQQSRAMLDMLIGFTMSPLLWKYVAPSLSAGRCQTPALHFVIDREIEIKEFSKKCSSQICGTWKGAEPESESESLVVCANLEEEFPEEKDAVSILEKLYSCRRGVVVSNKITQWSRNPPPPLITSTLQQQASAAHRIPPKQTMRIAQKLYESGLITYMRTDTAVLCTEARTAASAWVTKNLGKEFVSFGSVRKVDALRANANAKEAHEAIRPTHFEMENPDRTMTHQEKAVYRLIWQRAVQSVMMPSRGKLCTVELTADAYTEHNWNASWKKTDFQGWQRLGKVADCELLQGDVGDPDADVDMAMWNRAIGLTPTTELFWQSVGATMHTTKPPPRYTEATLVRELERRGIGRPSTFASLLEAIQDRNYVEIKDMDGVHIEGWKYSMTSSSSWPPRREVSTVTIGKELKKLVPTNLGCNVLSFMTRHFADLFEYEFTADMEKRLDRVADGEEPWQDVLNATWISYKERYERLLRGVEDSTSTVQKGGKKGKAKISNARIRDFGDGLKAVMSRKGPLILIEKADAETVFLGWPDGVLFSDLTPEIASEFRDSVARQGGAAGGGLVMGQWNGSDVIRKKGKFGYYVTYSSCTGTDDSKKLTTSVAEEDTFEEIVKKLEVASKRVIKKIGDYEVHNGQYGPYIFKKSLAKKRFVSVPKDVNPETLTEAQIEKIYVEGCEKKKRFPFKKK